MKGLPLAALRFYKKGLFVIYYIRALGKRHYKTIYEE